MLEKRGGTLLTVFLFDFILSKSSYDSEDVTHVQWKGGSSALEFEVPPRDAGFIADAQLYKAYWSSCVRFSAKGDDRNTILQRYEGKVWRINKN